VNQHLEGPVQLFGKRQNVDAVANAERVIGNQRQRRVMQALRGPRLRLVKRNRPVWPLCSSWSGFGSVRFE
jgi:hypothetical protein